uniref:Putative glucose/ribitol dehydrogenase n=1 Tax=Helianthus annuus TaxID=4232 RepID=A0A251RKI8_HELAN
MPWISIFTGKSGFAASSTAEDVTKGIDGTGLTAIVTGATSGIGLETARVLALRGVHVVMPVRNIAAGEKAKESIAEEVPNAKLDVMELDVSSQESVRKFASQYCSKGLPLNILILNAGIMSPPFTLSKDNIELQFATNHLGNFLLTNLLLDTMKKTARESGKEGRIVILSSELHQTTYKEGIMFDKINDEKSYNAILNAGIMSPPFTLSKDNIELQFATNHLGNFLLTNLLLDTMKKTARESGKEGRIVILSSELHQTTYKEGIMFDKINDEQSYNAMYAYGQSKLANALHAKELTRRLQEEGVNITANSLHPGVINTNLLRHNGIFAIFFNVVQSFLKNIPQGAATTCYVAMHPQLKGVSGEYFADSNLKKASKYAQDPELAKKLWDFSEKLTQAK